MRQTNPRTGKVLVEKLDSQRNWTTSSMDELHEKDIFRLGGVLGLIYRADEAPKLSVLYPNEWSVVCSRIVLEDGLD